MIPECINPYPGPESFGRGDARPYFGRDQETSDLTSMAVTERLMVFYAPSGAGKTSLLNMRLIPRLEEKLYEVLPMARVSGMVAMPAKVRNVYAYNLMLRLAPGDAHPERFAQLSLSDFLWHLSTEDGKSYHYDPSNQALRLATPARELWPRVLILDQFEEIVTAYPTFWRHREDFFRQLDEALASDAMLRVIMSLRADYVQDLERYAGLLQHGLRARYQMFLLGTEDAHLAIEGPAAACGRPLGAGVAPQLVRNMSQIRGQNEQGQPHFEPGETVEPIQLQVVCYQLWESMKGTPGDKIELKDLRRLAREAVAAQAGGGELTQRQQYEALSAFVDGALGAFYESALKKTLASAAPPVDEGSLRTWFSSKLITDGGTRGFLQRGHDETGGVPEAVVQALVDHHLLRSDTRGSARLVELIHDRFVEPILRFNQRWSVEQLQRDPLLRRAYEWAASAPALAQRDPRLLLSDDELASPDLAGRALEPTMHEFVEASREAKKDRDLASERQRNEESQRKLTEAEQRTAQEKTFSRRLRVAVGIATIMAVLALVAGFVVFLKNNDLNAANVVAEHSERTAVAAAADADNERSIARSLMLANQSLALDLSSLEDRLLLAHAATEISPTTLLAYTALLGALDSHAPLTDGSATAGSGPSSAAAAPDVGDLSQIPEFASVLAFAAPLSPTLQAVSPSGRWLAVAQDGRALWLGEAVDAAQPISISVPAGVIITAAALSDDGVYVAWASCRSQPASESLTPTPTPTPTSTPTRAAKPNDTPTPTAAADPLATPTTSPTPNKTPNPNQPTPTGAPVTDCLLAIARADEEMLTSPELTIPAPKRIVAVALRPQQIDQGALALETGVIQTFDRAATTALASQVKGAVDVAFSSDGDYLAALDEKGQVSIWAWTGAEPVELYEPDLGKLTFVAIEFAQGDAWLALATTGHQLALWDRRSESLIHRFDLPRSVADLALSADGSTLLAALPGSTVRWPMEPARWLELACARAGGRNLSYDAWRKAFPNADPEDARICPGPLDISFAQALVIEAERKLDNCRSETWDAGLALLKEAQQADPRLNLNPSAHRTQVVGGQALEYLRDDDDEGARECLALATDGQAALDQTFQAAASLVQAERLLAEGQSKDMAEVVAALDQALELKSYWPGPQVEMAQSGLAQALYSLCQQGVASACQRAAALIDLLEEGATVQGELLNGAGPALYFQGRRGQAVTIAMNAANNAFDAFLSLEGPGGAAISDDDSGSDYNSLIANYLLPHDGIYRIAPGGYGGGGSGAYTVQFDLSATRPISPGIAETSTTAQDSLWQFPGQAGQLVSIRMDTADASFDPYLTLYGPDATQLRSDDDSGGGWNALIVAPLPADGSYTLNTGRPDSSAPYTLTVSQSRPLPFDQPQPSITLSDTLWVFESAGSPVIGLEITTASDALTPRLALRDASGVELPNSATSSAPGQARLTAYVLPAGDRFIVQVTADGGALPYTLTLTSLTTPALTLDRPVTSTTQADPLWTFSGQAGQMVDLALNSARLPFDPALRLLNAEGREIAYDNDSGGNLNARLAALFLPADGQYFVQPLPAGSPVSYTLTVSSVTSQTIRLLQPGETVTSTLRQDTLWAFDGRIGQPIAFTASTPTGATPSLSIEGANGEVLRYPESGAIAAFFLPETGRYYLRVGGLDQTTLYNLALQEHQPPEISFDETQSSNTVANELWRFRGQAGQVVDIGLTGWSSGGSFDPHLTLLAADGTELAFNDDISSGNWNARIAAFLLPETGDYFIRAGRPGSTAPYQLRLTSRSPLAASVAATMLTQESAAFTLSVPQPGFVSIAVTPAAELSLMGPGDTAWARQASAILARLDAAGVYTVGVSFPADGQPRNVAMLPIAATPRPLDWTQSNQGRLPAGGADLWTLDVDAAQAVRVTASGAGFTPMLELYAPDGGRLAVGDPNEVLVAALPAAGDSLLAVRGPTVQASGPYTLTIQPMDATPGPQACTGSSDAASYLSVPVGSQVVLGRHRPVNGEENWNPAMDAYVGQQASVTGLADADGQGCPVVQVDIDQGQFSWRVRDLLVLD
jgi:hypothetical protein